MMHFITAETIIRKLAKRTDILRLLFTAIMQGMKKGNKT